MSGSHENLWAPWRMAYIEQLQDRDGGGGCFLCRYRADAEHDRENFVVCRSANTFVLLNRFPYNNGHLLVAPLEHVAQPEDLPDAVLNELTARLRDAKRALERAFSAQGFNIGMNLGRCAGAGLPDHLHWHIVPRWSGDTNYMSALGGTRVIPQSLSDVFEKLSAAMRELNL